MVILVRELDPQDLRQLYSSDPALREEVGAINRSLRRLDESVSTWCCLDPATQLDGEEVTSCPAA